MQFVRSEDLPGLLRRTPEAVPFVAIEEDFLTLLARAEETGTSPILVSEEDLEVFEDDWRRQARPSKEDWVRLSTPVQPMTGAEYWTKRERIRREFELYAQKKYLEAAEATVLSAVEDGRLTCSIQELLDALSEHARGVEQNRQVDHMRLALAGLGRADVDEAHALYLEKEPVRLRRATQFAAETLVHVFEFEGEPWRLPASFAFGGFNHCPPTSEQVVLLRAWYEEYGARVVMLGTGCLGMFVERPPVTIATRRDVGFMHWLYADDGRSKADWIAAQAASDVWFFSWD